MRKFFEFREKGMGMERSIAMANRITNETQPKKRPGKFTRTKGTDEMIQKLIENSVKDTKRECLTRILSNYITKYKQEKPEIIHQTKEIYLHELKLLDTQSKIEPEKPKKLSVDIRRFLKKEKEKNLRAQSARRTRMFNGPDLPLFANRKNSEGHARVAIHKFLNGRNEEKAREILEKNIKIKIESAKNQKNTILKQRSFNNKFNHVFFAHKK